ncbi:MAG: bifunctional chorismate mutase/prephenate dehydratase [Candidatus Faecousia sp.]|nr:bifunctional chorismate mutase/prephenate dehydratase [Clostridiales bacterium]MDD7651140.1 bifunctional chorismate mutase/prephenate dehydratase [Bacillota bacterium]MDY4220178.1 bifunctional chorismate mutase/prephenate dehydratase [Candidatus Faecousia sp.]
MDLKDYRQEIDAIDDQLVDLFHRRMEVAAEIAAYKKEKGLPVLDAGREREKIKDLTGKMPPELRNYTSVLYSSLFELSRSYQNRQLLRYTELYNRIADAIEHTTPLFPQDATVAICGVEGAFAQIACEKLFPRPFLLYINSFEGVFSAIESGLCQYGVVPLENSTAGSVKKIYDLMISHRFSIVRSARLKVDHNLLAKPGTRLEDVKEIFSHEQAIGQCAQFLKTLGPEVKLTVCENTAMAAKLVAQSERRDVAAICSRNCMELYGLKCLRSAIQDSGNNYTRFICISKNLEIYPGADRTSIMLATAHKPGALYKLLARFYALGINITKLESRPIPDRDFEFMFYFDLETSIYSQEFVQIICELSASCEEFTYLGSYSEVV